jgi:nucleoid-associated protein YgaU
MPLENTVKLIIKKISLNEETISTILGGMVVLTVGVLIFNYFKTLKSFPEITQQAAQTQNQELIAQENKFYTVKTGDSLSSIAQNLYGDSNSWILIAQQNDISQPNLIEVGQQLQLPSDMLIAENVITNLEPQVLSAESIEKIMQEKYTIQVGDSLQLIAERALADPNRWPEIARANNILYPDYIEVGQEIIIPR